jgi:hypothetical protein
MIVDDEDIDDETQNVIRSEVNRILGELNNDMTYNLLIKLF